MKIKYRILALATLSVVTADQLSKDIVTQRMRLGQSVDVIRGVFSISYVRNTGAAFGFMAHSDPSFRTPFFIIVPLIALGAIGYVFRKIQAENWRLSAALSMVIGGAVGNLVDRLRLGYVVDFLDFHWQYEYHFPAFNLADSAICVGVLALVLDLMLDPQMEDKRYASAPR